MSVYNSREQIDRHFSGQNKLGTIAWMMTSYRCRKAEETQASNPAKFPGHKPYTLRNHEQTTKHLHEYWIHEYYFLSSKSDTRYICLDNFGAQKPVTNAFITGPDRKVEEKKRNNSEKDAGRNSAILKSCDQII